MTSYRVKQFMLARHHPAIQLDRPVTEEVHPVFKIIGADDEMADTMFALYENGSFQQRWHPHLCEPLIEFLHDIAEAGFIYVQAGDTWQRYHYSDDETQLLDEAADHIEAVV